MLGPYAIAHLKTSLELRDEGVDDAEATILLTDTLDHEPPQLRLETMRDPVTVEGEMAAELKQSERFTIVIGNPPYDREQRDVGDKAKRKGGVIRYGAAGLKPLLDDITSPMREAGLGVHIKNLYNDYVYFWRWAIWQAVELPRGPGIVAFITASSYVDGLSMGGLRALLRDRFDELWIADLGGEGRGAMTEENVFEIRTPVAIAFGVCASAPASPECTVRYTQLQGTRAEKFHRLSQLTVDESWTDIPGQELDRMTPQSHVDYFSWPPITNLLPWIHTGAEVKRSWPIGETRSVLLRRWETFSGSPRTRRLGLFKETRDREVAGSYAPLLKASGESRLKPLSRVRPGDSLEAIQPYSFRSFDEQWVIADSRVGDYFRPALWTCHSDKQVYLTTMTTNVLGRGPVLTVARNVPDRHHFSARGGKDVLPLYRDRHATVPNATGGLLDVLTDRLAMNVTWEDFAAYSVALLGTAAFGEKFAVELAEAAGPVRLPITTNPKLFTRAVQLGRELIWWHTRGERFSPDGRTTLPVGTAKEIEPVRGYPETFHYDASDQRLTVGTGVFGPVSPEVWRFEVSGLHVMASWLGYRMRKRKGKRSSPLDDIRPSRWTFTAELFRVLAILERTLDITPRVSGLLDEIVSGPLLLASELPQPTDAERKPPPVS